MSLHFMKAKVRNIIYSMSICLLTLTSSVKSPRQIFFLSSCPVLFKEILMLEVWIFCLESTHGKIESWSLLTFWIVATDVPLVKGFSFTWQIISYLELIWLLIWLITLPLCILIIYCFVKGVVVLNSFFKLIFFPKV